MFAATASSTTRKKNWNFEVQEERDDTTRASEPSQKTPIDIEAL